MTELQHGFPNHVCQQVNTSRSLSSLKGKIQPEELMCSPRIMMWTWSHKAWKQSFMAQIDLIKSYLACAISLFFYNPPSLLYKKKLNHDINLRFIISWCHTFTSWIIRGSQTWMDSLCSVGWMLYADCLEKDFPFKKQERCKWLLYNSGDAVTDYCKLNNEKLKL